MIDTVVLKNDVRLCGHIKYHGSHALHSIDRTIKAGTECQVHWVDDDGSRYNLIDEGVIFFTMAENVEPHAAANNQHDGGTE